VAMYLHVYLPDDLGAAAKAAKLNLSGLLRRAVEAELRGEGSGVEVLLRRDGDVIEVVIRIPDADVP
jgi:hypothetical protein